MNRIFLKRLVFGLTGVICGWSVCLAQTLDVDDILNPSADLSEWTTNGTRSSVFITQAGRLNDAQILQNTPPPAGLSQTNLVRVLQLGEENFAQTNASGANNRTDVLQNGTKNNLVSNVQGANNLSRLVQNGNTNTLIQTLVNTNNVQTDFLQNGDNNRIEQEINGVTNLPVRLIQNGNGLNAIIRQINL